MDALKVVISAAKTADGKVALWDFELAALKVVLKVAKMVALKVAKMVALLVELKVGLLVYELVVS